jgi:hypothetical protein
MIDAARARRSQRTSNLFEQDAKAARIVVAPNCESRVDGSSCVRFKVLTAFSLARDRENEDNNQAGPVSIDVPQMREDTASAWI